MAVVSASAALAEEVAVFDNTAVSVVALAALVVMSVLAVPGADIADIADIGYIAAYIDSVAPIFS